MSAPERVLSRFFAPYFWQRGQKKLERWPTTTERIGVAQTTQGLPVRS